MWTPRCQTMYALALALLAVLAVRTTPAADPDADAPEKVLRELRAAEEARIQHVRELEEWEMEKQRLQLLEDALEDQARRLEEQAAETQEDLGTLRTARERVQTARDRREAILQALDSTAEKLEGALARVAAAGPPALVPPDFGGQAASTDPRVRLSNALSRLRETEEALRTCDIELVSGILDGNPRTAHVLRLGGVAAWWMGLDGEELGTVSTGEQGIVFDRADTEADASAIRRAFNVRWGREVPDWVDLRLEGAK